MTDDSKRAGEKFGAGSTSAGAGTAAGLAIAKPAPEPDASLPGNLSADMPSAMMDGFMRAFAGIGCSDRFTYPALSAACRRATDAVSAASRLSMQGADLVANCELRIFQETMNDLGEAMRELMSADTPAQRAAHYVKLSRQGYERVVSGTHELSNLIRNNQWQALELLNRCVLDTMAEVEELFEKNNRHPA